MRRGRALLHKDRSPGGQPLWAPAESPARGLKVARLHFSDGMIKFAPVSGRSSYGVVAVARCEMPAMTTSVPVPLPRDRLVHLLTQLVERFDHRAPMAECSCGFYATLGAAPLPSPAEVLLDVKLAGRVLGHGEARRSERQQVLSLAIPRVCAAGLAHGTAPVEGAPAGEEGERDAPEPPRCGRRAVALGVEGEAVLPLCERHLTQEQLGTGDVAVRAGVPASWAESQLVPASPESGAARPTPPGRTP